MGGLAEAHAPGANVGQTFQVIIAKQFAGSQSGRSLFLDPSGVRPENSSDHPHDSTQRHNQTECGHAKPAKECLYSGESTSEFAQAAFATTVSG